MATPRFLSATNGFVPQATNQAIAYVRDRSEFAFNEYCQIVNAPAPIGVFAKLDPDQPVRVVTDQEFDWPDGDPRPVGSNNMGNFVWQEFRVYRRDYPYTVGHQAVETAQGWNPKAFFNATILSQACTNLTNRLVTLMEDTTQYPAANVSDANTWNKGAGGWDRASADPTSPYFLAIKRTILAMLLQVKKATNGVVKVKDMRLVISPGLAYAMANTSEIHTFMGNQVNAIKVLQGDEPNVNADYGLPPRLYGPQVVVEDAVIVKERPNAAGTAATANRTFVKSDKTANLLSRPGGLDGNYGSPSYSTLQRFYYKYEMAIESFDDPKNKLFESHVLDQYKEVIAADRSGAVATNCQ